MRREFWIISLSLFGITGYLYYLNPYYALVGVLWVPLFIIGIRDMTQKKRTILRNFPVIGHFRYMLELIRPEINQYFIESNHDGTPFSREQRSVIYQRAKGDMDTLPFGTQKDVYSSGYECFKHSNYPTFHHEIEIPRVKIGGKDCKKPYQSSILNISAMSFGSLGDTSILSLNKGAKIGEFAHNTGEGGVTKYHSEHGGDLIWQIGTGYFGTRTLDGRFDSGMFQEKSKREQIKMIEVKISQGAKPGHGGILPAIKVTPELAEIRNIPMGKDVISPPGHTAFSCDQSMLDFICQLREWSGGKPVGIKFCLGRFKEFWRLAKLMEKTNQYPDYIAVDGAEGGTGAAPLELSNHVGIPLIDAIIYVHNILTGLNLRKNIKIGASGKVTTGFGILKMLSIGADFTYSARGMMMALGCIQAIRCNSNACPAGIATQDPALTKGVDVENKSLRVARYHSETLKGCEDIMATMGLKSTLDLRPSLLMRRQHSGTMKSYAQIYHFLEEGDLLEESTDLPYPYQDLVSAA